MIDDDSERAMCEQYTHCVGLFVCGDSNRVCRCSTCMRFETDDDAAACAGELIDLLREVAYEIKAPTVADALDELVKRARRRA